MPGSGDDSAAALPSATATADDDDAAEAGRVAHWLASGVVALTGPPDGPPLVPPGWAATRAVELAAHLAAVGVVVDGPALLAERAAFTGSGGRRGRTSAGGSCRLLPTADGWAAVSCARPDDPLLLGALIGAAIGDDPWAPVAAWLRARTGAELAGRAALLGVAAAPVAAQPAAPSPGLAPPRAMAGRLVVDFSALWAGPLCAQLLGLAGARIVKVETPTRPDGARRGPPGFYRLLHAGHRSVVLDPDEPHQRRALHALVAAADVVIEASRPRALAAWGLEPAGTDATWVSITAAGRASDRVGFGDDVAAGAGLVASAPDGTPVFAGDAIADPLAGLTAAALAVSAPPGALVDVSMAATVAATLLPPAATGTVVGVVAPPRRREAVGVAPETGTDTAAVLREIGC